MAIHYEGTEVVNGVRQKVVPNYHKAVVQDKDYKRKSTKKAEKEATKAETDTFVEDEKEQDNAKDN